MSCIPPWLQCGSGTSGALRGSCDTSALALHAANINIRPFIITGASTRPHRARRLWARKQRWLPPDMLLYDSLIRPTNSVAYLGRHFRQSDKELKFHTLYTVRIDTAYPPSPCRLQQDQVAAMSHMASFRES